MARAKKPEEPPAGSPAWMATFSDLMNLLLCFFVLLFSMSSVDAEKFKLVVQSLQSNFSILPAGGTSIGDGNLISAGISALEMFDIYFNASTALPEGENEPSDTVAQQGIDNEEGISPEDISAETAQEALATAGEEESEMMAEQISALLDTYGVTDEVTVEYTEQYVVINLDGALLFSAGEATLRTEVEPVMDKICLILGNYTNNMIEVEGHSDNVPPGAGERYESNDILSMYRALNVADFIRANTNLDPANIKSSGRGSYDPIADNTTAEGRARNRRVELKIYNSLNS